MVARARLVPPPTVRTNWPWHNVEGRGMSVSLMLGGDRRMEAENFLAGGFATRIAIEAKSTGWTVLGNLAEPWQPSRLKGIQVSKEYGTPFLTATQTLDIRPSPRKWLSLDRTDNAAERFVDPGTILVTCSGNVGRATIARNSVKNILVSHDILRISPKSRSDWGWIYAYLRAPQVRAMMISAQYGHIIKHLETSHLATLPIVEVDGETTRHFQAEAQKLLKLRNESHDKLVLAEKIFADSIGPISRPESEAASFSVSSKELIGPRRRLEAAYHAPEATAILRHFSVQGLKTEVLSSLAERVWWMTRFKRVFGEDGAPYKSADELFSLNPVISKRVLTEQAENASDYFVKAGWLMMACSGQVYGTLGSVALMTESDEDTFFSHDLVRIIPRQGKVRPGYLFVALSHPTVGRPLVLRYAYGTSIPHLEPADISTFPVVRLGDDIEKKVSTLAESAIALRSEADELENSLASQAGEILDAFIAD